MSRHFVFLIAALIAAAQASAGVGQVQSLPAAQIGRAEDRSPGSSLRAEDARVAGVAYRLAVAGAAHCPDPFPLSGLIVHHLAEYRPADRAAWIQGYGLDRGIGVLGTVADSSAAAAGLRAGDVIVRIDDAPIRTAAGAGAPEPAAASRAGIEAGEDQLEAALRAGRARLTILRDGRDVTIMLGSRPGCPARVRLARSGQTNAFATARHVILTSATLDFVGSDDELAVVLAHELAHVVLGHSDRLARDGVPRGVLRGFGKNAARIRATEEEADRLGIRLAWAAGYNAAAAIPFWRRYYSRFDGPQLFRTHPSLADRERLIAATLTELQLGAQRPELGKGALPER